MNDIVFETGNSNFEMYADDSTLYEAASCPQTLGTTLSQSCKPLSKWVRNNKMVLNTEKTETILIGTSRRRDPVAQNYSVVAMEFLL